MLDTTVSHYRIVELLGGGGMGMVYRAEDLVLGRMVALKFLAPELARDPHALERFTREAKSAAALNHPNICTVYEIGQHDGQSFIALELLEGHTVKHVIDGRSLPVETVLTYGLEIASALAAAHAKGVVHRDIKPGNLFVTTLGHIKVLDFGLAKLAAGDATPSPDPAGDTTHTRVHDEHLTAPGTALGTVAYMSPEQAGGLPVDARTDLYSLGVVLYEMTTGALPFTGPTAAVVFGQILHHDPPPPSTLNAAVPAMLDRIIAKAMARDTAQRYASADELRADLARVVRLGDSLQLTAASEVAAPAVAQPAAPARPRRVMVTAGAAIAAAVAAAVAFLRPTPTPALTNRDPVVLADVENRTGDPVFDGTLRAALNVAIAQSPYLNVVPEARVRETLRLMGRPPDARVTGDVGREVCQREQAKALLSGTIAELGGAYALTVEALACATGESLGVEQERVAGKAQVLDALGTAAANLRRRLGESLVSVQAMDVPLARATTSSLEALKAFSLAEASRVAGGDGEAIGLFRRALELDPDFALAHARLGTVLSNRDEQDESIRHQQRAFELRDRVSEYERFYITSHYYGNVTDEVPKYLEVLRVWQRTYPNDFTAPNNLAVIELQMGDYDAAIVSAREAQRLTPRHILPRLNLSWALYFAGHLDEAAAVVHDSVAAGLSSDFLREVPLWSAYYRGDTAALQRELADQGDLGRRDVRTFWRFAPWYLLHQGKGQEAVKAWTALAGRERQAGRKDAEILALAKLARVQALLGHAEEAREAARTARALVGAARPPLELGFALAVAGDVDGARDWLTRIRAAAPVSTFATQLAIPEVLAVLALRDRQPQQALEALRPVGSLERSYGASARALRVRALREAGQFAEAKSEAQAALAQPWLAGPQGIDLVLALELARAAAGAGDIALAKKTYQDLLTSWAGGDADFPLTRQARAELARLGS